MITNFIDQQQNPSKYMVGSFSSNIPEEKESLVKMVRDNYNDTGFQDGKLKFIFKLKKGDKTKGIISETYIYSIKKNLLNYNLKIDLDILDQIINSNYIYFRYFTKCCIDLTKIQDNIEFVSFNEIVSYIKEEIVNTVMMNLALLDERPETLNLYSIENFRFESKWNLIDYHHIPQKMSDYFLNYMSEDLENLNLYTGTQSGTPEVINLKNILKSNNQTVPNFDKPKSKENRFYFKWSKFLSIENYDVFKLSGFNRIIFDTQKTYPNGSLGEWIKTNYEYLVKSDSFLILTEDDVANFKKEEYKYTYPINTMIAAIEINMKKNKNQVWEASFNIDDNFKKDYIDLKSKFYNLEAKIEFYEKERIKEFNKFKKEIDSLREIIEKIIKK